MPIRRPAAFPITVCLAAACLAFGAGGVLAQAKDQGRTWSVAGHGTRVVATDCTDCGDDIGMMLECRSKGAPAAMHIPWAAADRIRRGARMKLEFAIMGEHFTYPANTVLEGQAGYVPTTLIGKDDPMFARMLTGQSIHVRFAGRDSEISLEGSREALTVFAANCGWTLPEQTTGGSGDVGPAGGGGGGDVDVAPAAAPDHMVWQSGSDAADNRGWLVLGVPETDNTAFDASCRLGSGIIVARMPPVRQGFRPGQQVEVAISGDAVSERYPGTITDRGWVSFQTRPADALWKGLLSGGAIRATVDGVPAGTLASEPGQSHIRAFLQTCQFS